MQPEPRPAPIGCVTAIIPTYNRAALLAEAIESILAQGVTIERVIVCDDGSSDDTGETARSFGPRVSYLYQANSGKSAAVNNALAHCNTPYVWLCDDDDIACPGALERLVVALETTADAGMAYGNAASFRDTPQGRLLKPMAWLSRTSGDLFHRNLLTNRFLLQACLFRRSRLAEIGPFDPALLRSQDWDFALRALERLRALHVDVEVFHVREHEGLRGPEKDRFEASERRDKWDAYNRLVVANSLTEIEVKRFALVPIAAGPNRVAASGHLVRFAFACRKGVWDAGFLELDALLEHASALPDFELDPSEREFLDGLFSTGSAMIRADAPLARMVERFAAVRHGSARRALLKPVRRFLAGQGLRHIRHRRWAGTLGALRLFKRTLAQLA
jgi:glycosyltransferase involved in cell wall biosynthesis